MKAVNSEEMAFKIVQTIEYDVPKLTVVPRLWESKGIVRWPPKNVKFAKLIKDGNSRPGPDWKSFKCALKRNYIPTYEEAIRELCEMEQNTDTDYDNDNCSVPGTSDRERATDDISFDARAHLDNAQQSANRRRTTAANVYSEEQDSVPVFNSRDIQTVIANQTAMLRKLNVVVENQRKMALQLASLSRQLEETKASISQEKERPVNVTLMQDQFSLEETDTVFKTPIENEQQLEIFERNLADPALKKKYSKMLSLLCSVAVGSGITCAYKLTDVLISRDFLCRCSWSGGSKGEGTKIAIKFFKNFRQFFFEIINSWDPTFTHDDAERFLKVILKNAKKRSVMKGLRQSSKRNRPRRMIGNEANRVQQLLYNAINIQELQAGDEEEQESGKHTEQIEIVDNNEPTESDVTMDLC